MQHLFQPPRLQTLANESYHQRGVQVAVLRLDEIHPVISGNKWFKLKAYLEEAKAQGKKAVLTFGGAWSNHIVATAAACAQSGLQPIGIIRGERPNKLSHTLEEAQHYGMQLFFVSREDYKNKVIPETAYGILKKACPKLAERFEIYEIAEGGYGEKGAAGSMDILKSCNTKTYSHIVAAVGTGTMLAGLINAAHPHQKIIGVSVLKNNVAIESAVQNLLSSSTKSFQIIHDFHFGGYAKHTPELLQFMNAWYAETLIPTDFVYTAKTFYAVDQLIKINYFETGNSVLVIHSGGLQGNRSLPTHTLYF